MRLLIVIAVIPTLAYATSGARPMTVSQLDQLLAQQVAPSRAVEHRASAPEEISDISDSDVLGRHDGNDDALVGQLAGVELSERLSTTTMFRLIWKHHLSPRVQLVLEQLSDRTALLNLPPGEEPKLSSPDFSSQQAMLQAARSWVVSELSHLPNFIATETTTHFDDAPAPLKYWENLKVPGLHRGSSVQHQVTFRDGKEVVDDPHTPDRKPQSGIFESRGEFGTEAAVVLMDVQKGSVTFSNWETTMAGVAAVFKYSVPAGASHYEVKAECGSQRVFRHTPGYHGTLAIDPKTGAIFRMTLEADSSLGDPVSHVASVIEYGPVVLGHHRSICPLRSLAFMIEETSGCMPGGRGLQKPVSMINQTIFSNYHRFGSSSSLIFDEAENGDAAPHKTPPKPGSSPESPSPVTPASAAQKRHP